jgi:small GTP-binding protein
VSFYSVPFVPLHLCLLDFQPCSMGGRGLRAAFLCCIFAVYLLRNLLVNVVFLGSFVAVVISGCCLCYRRFGWRRWREQNRVVVLGLDNSGKTTLIQMLAQELFVYQTLPTFHACSEDVVLKRTGARLKLYDPNGSLTGGRSCVWRQYVKNVEGVVFVIDAAETRRICEATQFLYEIVAEMKKLEKPIPLLIFGNKIDICHSLGSIQLTVALCQQVRIYAAQG